MMRPRQSVKRREFLAKSVGFGLAAVTAALAGPTNLFAKTNGGSRVVRADAPRLGAGEHTYEWTPNWAQLPASVELKNCHGGIAIDSQGRVFLNTDTENSVMMFDPSGKFIKGWGKDYRGGAHGLMIRREGRQEFAYITHHARHELIKTTLDGELVWTRGFPAELGVYKSAAEYKPTAVAFAPNGDIYVTDGYGKHWVHHYNKSGDYIRSWGGTGSEPGKLNQPHGIWVDSRGKALVVVVADRANHRLQTFSLDGKHLGFTTDGMRLPSNMDQRGGALAVADLAGKVTILDRDNKVVTHLGDNADEKKRGTNKLPPAEWQPGVFVAPHSVRWDKAGNLYVHEWSLAGRVIKLKKVS